MSLKKSIEKYFIYGILSLKKKEMKVSYENIIKEQISK